RAFPPELSIKWSLLFGLTGERAHATIPRPPVELASQVSCSVESAPMHIRSTAVVACLISLVSLAWQPKASPGPKPPAGIRALPGPMDVLYWDPREANYR